MLNLTLASPVATQLCYVTSESDLPPVIGALSKHAEAAVGVLDQDVVIAVPLLKCVSVLHAAATAAVDAADFSVRRGSARAGQRCSSG